MQEKEPLPENRNPLNQKALKFLKSLKQEIDQNYLYSLQLAEWALENTDLIMRDQETPQYLSNLMACKSQAAAWKWLTTPEGEKEPGDLASLKELREMKDPVDLAWRILDQIQAMAEAMPNYYG